MDIKNNFRTEIEIINQIKNLKDEKRRSPELEDFYSRTIISLLDELDALNKSIPDFLGEKRLEKVRGVYVSGKEKEKLLQALQIEEENLKSIKRVSVEKAIKEERVGMFPIIASRLFSNMSFRLRKGKFFSDLYENLRKANMPLLLTTYISMILLSTLIAIIAGIGLSAFFISQGQTGIGLGALLLPVVVFFFVYLYPSSKSSSIKSKIDDELPFAIIHMSAISGSGVTPSQIFEIIARSPDYPSIGSEMRKIVNQINLYGYSLVNSLRDTAKTTASPRLAELLNGIALTLSAGGNLGDYLEKNAADTLVDYKLRRRRYITISETYADIYTGLLITAPLIFMLILVLVNILGGTVGGMTPETMAILGIGGVIVINIGFIVFLEISQPKG